VLEWPPLGARQRGSDRRYTPPETRGDLLLTPDGQLLVRHGLKAGEVSEDDTLVPYLY
jgi:hypothetical protein